MDLYGDQLKKPHTTIVECHFDEYFDQQIQQLEKTALSQDTRSLEAATSVSPFVGKGDEPPPLPRLHSRGVYIPRFVASNKRLTLHRTSQKQLQ